MRGDTMQKRDGQINICITKEEKEYWKRMALDCGYMNFTQFIRDAIDMKIQAHLEEKKGELKGLLF